MNEALNETVSCGREIGKRFWHVKWERFQFEERVMSWGWQRDKQLGRPTRWPSEGRIDRSREAHRTGLEHGNIGSQVRSFFLIIST